MPEYVRVTDTVSGHHYTIPRTQYDSSPSSWRLLKQPALGVDGRPLPPTYKTPDADPAPEKQAAKSANTDKEK